MNNNFWTIKKVITGKLLWVLIGTYLLSDFFIKGADTLVNYIMNKDNQGIAISNYTFLPYSLILIVPACLLSVLIIWLYCKIKTSRMDLNNPTVMKKLEREASFKWSMAYSIAIGYFILFVWMKLWQMVGDVTYGSVPALLLQLAGFCIIPFLVMKPLNKWLVKYTKTNADLVEELAGGVYGKIPERYMNDEALVGIINVLENGMASSLWGAIIVYELLKITSKVFKTTVKVSAVVGGLIVILTMGVMNTANGEIGTAFSDITKGMRQEEKNKRTAQAIVGALERNGWKVKRVIIH